MAEPRDNQLRKVMEQRAYTRIGQAKDRRGKISQDKIEEVAEVVETQVRLAREVGADAFRAVATAAIREAPNGKKAVRLISERAGIPISIISDEEEGRLAFLGATKGLGHPVEGRVAVVDVGGGSTEITLGTTPGGAEDVHSWPAGSGNLADELIGSDPPSPAEIRKIRERVEDVFGGTEVDRPDHAVAVGGTATSLRRMVGTVLEYETLERGIRILSSESAVEVGRQFELDPVRVRLLPTGILILEKASEILGLPLQIGRGGIREGMIRELLEESVEPEAASV